MKDQHIHILSIENQLRELKNCLQEGVDVDILSEYDCTPLHYACRGGNVEIVKFLIENGADINKKNRYSTLYPIFDALSSSNDKNTLLIIQLLVKNGVDINQVDSFGNTVLHYAVEQESIELIEFFLKLNCDVDKTLRYDKDTPLHYAYFAKNRKIILMLIENGANKNQKNIYNKAPFEY